MKKIILYTTIITSCLITSCSQKDYYSASNKNIQRFSTEMEENTAQYLLKLNDDMLLLKSVVDLSKAETKSNEIFEEAESLHRELTSLSNQLKIVATMNRITLSNTLSKQNDQEYQHFYSLKLNERDERFEATVSKKIDEIRKKADTYANEGNNMQIQKFSLEVRDRLETVSEQYS